MQLTLTEPDARTLRNLLLDCLAGLGGGTRRAADDSPDGRYELARRKVLCERLLWELGADDTACPPDRKPACTGTACRSGSRLSESEINTYRARLRATEARLGGAVTALENEARHPTASPLDTSEEATALVLLQSEGESLAEVAAALNRIDRGTFGRCEGCGKPVSRARLDALPHARFCIACARAAGVAD
ncbi:TraR/DksA C4-type zinc finger protein [bacterium]|nr:TraR/DksA C4-type zinc finger protein [bacterium]